jgi:hypothetical protein
MRAISSSLLTSPGEPETTGTPASAIKDLACALAPIETIAATGGPMNLIPCSWQASAKKEFSAKNP